MTVWVTSDTHFQHENIIKYCGRPFADSKLMDECLVDNWNSVVKPGDKVYHLGDVMFGSKKTFPKLFSKLNGRKRLVLGNHDDVDYLRPFFEKVMLWRVFGDWGLILTHIPIIMDEHNKDRAKHSANQRVVNVHGHIHTNTPPTKDHYCVCVEQTSYTPVNLEELRDYLR